MLRNGIGVVLIEDHVVIRQLFAQAVNALPGCRVVGEAATIETGYAMCLETRPDVVVLDLMLDGGSGLDLLLALRKARLSPRCLVFSGSAAPALVRRAMKLGAHGFVEKTAPLPQVLEAFKTVAAGGTYLCAGMEAAIRREEATDTDGSGETLTAREREVLRGIAQGTSNKEVAAALGVSVHTVENHRANLIRKTGIQHPAKLTLLAIKLGLIEARQP